MSGRTFGPAGRRLACIAAFIQTIVWVVGFFVASECLASESGLTQRATFRIPRQALDTALLEFSKQAGVPVSVAATAIGRLQAPALNGTMEAGTALNKLLDESGLSYEELDGIVTVLRANGTTARQAVRVAGVDEAQRAPESATSSGATAGSDAGANTVPAAHHEGPVEEVTITSHREFLSVDTSGTTNLPLPIEKVPQSISLVSNDFIEAADLKTLASIAEYTPGAVNSGNQEGYATLIKLRGFGSYRAIDGLPALNTGGGGYEPDYAIYDRLEVVKGPASVVYGVAPPGGVLNEVTKGATSQTPSYLSFQGGSWHEFRLEGQLAGALDADNHIRAIGVVVRDQGDSFVNELFHKKTDIYGGINIDLGDSITGYLHGGYERFERPSADGTQLTEMTAGTPGPFSRSFCPCSESLVMTNNVYHTEADVKWRPTDMLEFDLKGNYERWNLTGSLVYAQSLDATGDYSISGSKLTNFVNTNYGVGFSTIYHFDNLGLQNSFLSFSAIHQDSRSDGAFLLADFSNVNASNSQAAVSAAFNALLQQANTPFFENFRLKQTTLSAQSVVQVFSPLSVLVGASWATADSLSAVDGPNTDFKMPSNWSYRAGVTYEFLPQSTAYFSYSQSFVPQGYLEASGSVVPPLQGDQYEVGIKYRSRNGGLLVTGALYDIKQKNAAQLTSAVGGQDFFSPIGQVEHKGVELQALGKLTGAWQINTGYSYMDPKVTQDSDTSIVGKTELFLPKHTFSLFSTYTLQSTVARGLTFGVGLKYVSSMVTAYDNSTRNLPGYPVVDASLSYPRGKWLTQLNVHNVLNRRYFINNYASFLYGNVPGDPTNFALTVRRSF